MATAPLIPADDTITVPTYRFQSLSAGTAAWYEISSASADIGYRAYVPDYDYPDSRTAFYADDGTLIAESVYDSDLGYEVLQTPGVPIGTYYLVIALAGTTFSTGSYTPGSTNPQGLGMVVESGYAPSLHAIGDPVFRDVFSGSVANLNTHAPNTPGGLLWDQVGAYVSNLTGTGAVELGTSYDTSNYEITDCGITVPDTFIVFFRGINNPGGVGDPNYIQVRFTNLAGKYIDLKWVVDSISELIVSWDLTTTGSETYAAYNPAAYDNTIDFSVQVSPTGYEILGMVVDSDTISGALGDIDKIELEIYGSYGNKPALDRLEVHSGDEAPPQVVNLSMTYAMEEGGVYRYLSVRYASPLTPYYREMSISYGADLRVEKGWEANLNGLLLVEQVLTLALPARLEREHSLNLGMPITVVSEWVMSTPMAQVQAEWVLVADMLRAVRKEWVVESPYSSAASKEWVLNSPMPVQVSMEQEIDNPTPTANEVRKEFTVGAALAATSRIIIHTRPVINL